MKGYYMLHGLDVKEGRLETRHLLTHHFAKCPERWQRRPWSSLRPAEAFFHRPLFTQGRGGIRRSPAWLVESASLSAAWKSKLKQGAFSFRSPDSRSPTAPCFLSSEKGCRV